MRIITRIPQFSLAFWKLMKRDCHENLKIGSLILESLGLSSLRIMGCDCFKVKVRYVAINMIHAGFF
jgi:hypothetical protein